MTFATLRASSFLAARVIAVSSVVAGLLLWQPVAQAEKKSLAAQLMPLIEGHDGEVAVSVRHLATNEEFHYRQDQVMPTASLIKLPVLIETFRQVEDGKVDLQQKVTLQDDDKVPGSGVLTTHFSAGAELSVRDLVRLMIAYSDNTATNMVIDQIGLPATTAAMEQLGFPETRLNSKVYRGSQSIDPDRSKLYGLGSTRSADIVDLLTGIYRGTIASKSSCDRMMEHLLACEDRSRLPRYLPSRVKIAHKTGAVSAARCDAGIIWLNKDEAVAICVLTAKNADRSWNDDNSANVLIGRIGKAVYDHFRSGTNDQLPESLTVGDFGELVEAVQRTLNQRMTPSPDLGVDGDFGPATEAAVKNYQQLNKLPADGRIDSDDWKSLSPLVMTPAPVPDPAVINSAELSKQPSEDLNGPPVVSCKAWAIADAKSGDILFSDNADQRRHFASTTKVMTAYIVLKLAADDPEILTESLTYSYRADETRGSTSGIRAGETLSVAETLYGLMLPSGNDASVALAEHFGKRLQPDASDDADPLDLFVQTMNETADKLEMSQTEFRNPHGLSHDEHLSTAADLLKLAQAALQVPRFSDYVTTRQRGCTVTGPGGYTRNVVWKNTNRLLAIEGYGGVKTGTTTPAGACLISMSTRDGRQLLQVILGSASSTGRYVDARNLYRWAWTQLTDDADIRQNSAQTSGCR